MSEIWHRFFYLLRFHEKFLSLSICCCSKTKSSTKTSWETSKVVTHQHSMRYFAFSRIFALYKTTSCSSSHSSILKKIRKTHILIRILVLSIIFLVCYRHTLYVDPPEHSLQNEVFHCKQNFKLQFQVCLFIISSGHPYQKTIVPVQSVVQFVCKYFF